MLMDHRIRRYHKHDGELRSLPPHLHSHLNLVNITGFYGQKSQLELALHILRNSTMLKAMKIDPKPTVAGIHNSLFLKDSVVVLQTTAGWQKAPALAQRVCTQGVASLRSIFLKNIRNTAGFRVVRAAGA